jgi:hypothetical protein
MKSICLAAVLAVALSLSPGLSLSAKGGKTSCTTAGANFDIAYISSGPGLSSDGGLQYVNGELGVIGRINCDGQSLELSGVRHSYLTLGAALSGTKPAWADSPAPVAFFNIPLGKYFNNAQPDPMVRDFTTYLKVTMASPNLGYYFNMENPDADAPLNAPGGGVNTPLSTTLVNVHHIPAGSDPETWVVTPGASPAVGTLMSNAKGGLRTVGQFDAPFSITVTRQ